MSSVSWRQAIHALCGTLPQVFITLPVQHGATVEQKLRSLIVEIFHRLPTSEARQGSPICADTSVHAKSRLAAGHTAPYLTIV